MYGSLRWGRVAASDGGPDLDVGQPRRAELPADPRKGLVEVLVDVVPERLQGRDVEDARLVRQCAAATGLVGKAETHQLVDPPEERGQRLSRSGRRRDQRVAARADRGPAPLLWGGWPFRETALEPGADGGMEGVEGHGGTESTAPLHPLPGAGSRRSECAPRCYGAGLVAAARCASNSSSDSSTWLTACAIETSPAGLSDPRGQRWRMRPSVVETSSAILAASSSGMARTWTRPLAISMA